MIVIILEAYWHCHSCSCGCLKSTVDPNIYEKEGVQPRVYYTTVTTRDANGEQIPNGGSAIVANVLPQSGREEVASILDDKHDGTYEVLFKQPPAGKYHCMQSKQNSFLWHLKRYKLQVGLPDSGGEKVSQHITNSPFNFGIGAEGEIESDIPSMFL